MKNIDKKILLNPGPSTTTQTVKEALVVEDICPREKDFGSLLVGIRDDIVRVVNGVVNIQPFYFLVVVLRVMKR